MNQLSKICFSILVAFLFSGCSLLSPIKNDQTQYLLLQSSSYIVRRSAHPINILVAQPDTIAVYNTTDMAYTTKPYQIAYFSQNRWAETPSQMLHPLIVDVLQKTHYFHAVIAPPFAGQYDYLLNTQIIMLQQDFITKPGYLRFVVRAALTEASTNRVIATKQFTFIEPMRKSNPYSGVFAANRAVSKFLYHLALFCVENTGASAYRAGEG